MRKANRQKGPKPGQPGYDNSLGGQIRAARKSRHLSLRELGKAIKRTGGNVWMWEQNDTAPPGDILMTLQNQFPELRAQSHAPTGKDGISFDLGRIDIATLGPERLRIIADILEKQQQLSEQLRDLSANQPTVSRVRR